MKDLRQGPLKALSAAQRERFDHDGVLLPLRALTVAEAGEYRRIVEDAERDSDVSGNSLFLNGHLLYDWQHQLATKSQILDVVQDLIGPDLFIWKCQLWIK